MKVLIDGDVPRYSCGFAAETPRWVLINEKGIEVGSFRYKKELDEFANSGDLVNYSSFMTKDIGPVSHALGNAKDLIRKILLRTNATDYQIYISGKGNFREEIATILPYKGNRDSTHKPVHYDALTKYLTENWGAETVEGYEADDALAMEQYGWYEQLHPTYSKESAATCIATIDKDLNMVPGWHYNWNLDEMYWVDEETAITWFYCQLIMGDLQVDNIPGIKGKGKAYAYKVLKDCDTEEDMYWATLCAYQESSYEKPMEALIENARLLWMQRHEGEMWNPPA